MFISKLVLLAAAVAVALPETEAHGYLSEPVNRGSAWRKGFRTPVNYNDNENFCGGLGAFARFGGKCGECGDHYAKPRPRANENGGKYGKGVIVKTYNSGDLIRLTSRITANHMGHVAFALCPLRHSKELETSECFARYPLQFEDGSYNFKLKSGSGDHHMLAYLPEGLTCEHCVLQWTYTAGNNWGKCKDGTSKTGCGIQETFRTCSDIKIV